MQPQNIINKYIEVRRILNSLRYFRKNGIDYPVGILSLYKSKEQKSKAEELLKEELKGLEKQLDKNKISVNDSQRDGESDKLMINIISNV